MTVNPDTFLGAHRQPNKFAEVLISQTPVNKALDALAEAIQFACSKPIGLIGIGLGSMPGLSEILKSPALRPWKVKRQLLPTIHGRVSLQDWLTQAEKAIDWDEFAKTDIVLFGLEKVTGRSLLTVRAFVCAKLGLPEERVRTAVLIDRVGCEPPTLPPLKLDFCGFRVRGSQKGLIFGHGIDIDDEYAGEPSIWYTIRQPNGRFRKPDDWEMPDVLICGPHEDYPLDRWWGDV
jgi:hypoxanthine-guanine phosphoribosyltransferase